MSNQVFISKATEFFSQLNTRSMFVTIHKYCNNYHEVATHSILWHINYVNVVKRSRKIIKDYLPEVSDTIGKPFTVFHLWEARQEMLDSFDDTLMLGVGNNPRDRSSKAYDRIIGKNGKVVPGVKLHRKKDEVHLPALYRIKKVVICKGEYPKVDSAPLTLAKRWLRGKTPLIRWGQYVLTPGRFDQMVASHQTIVEKDCVRTFN